MVWQEEEGLKKRKKEKKKRKKESSRMKKRRGVKRRGDETEKDGEKKKGWNGEGGDLEERVKVGAVVGDPEVLRFGAELLHDRVVQLRLLAL